MSRTWHHGDKQKRRRFPEFHFAGTPPADPTPPKRKRRDLPWQWLRATPSEWNYLHHTRPWRRRVDAEIHREMQCIWYDDLWSAAHSACAPGAYRRPHVYYW